MPDDKSLSNNLLAVVEVRVGQNPINFNQSFDADANWLNTLRVRVKNISGKSIISLSVGFRLFERVDQSLGPDESERYLLPLLYGKNAFFRKQGPSVPVVKPNQEVELGFNDTEKLFQNIINEAGEGFFCKAEFIIARVQYKDGKWEAGGLLNRAAKKK